MTFRNLVAYLEIKIWIKFKLTKIRVGENRKHKKHNYHQNELERRDPKFNLLPNHASIGHISIISTPNCDLFRALDSWLPKLPHHMWFSLRNLLKIASILAQIWYHCAAMHFAQPFFNLSYLPYFNSKLWSV